MFLQAMFMYEQAKSCLWQEFQFDLKEMIKLKKKEDEITTYLEFVKDVFKFEHQKPMLSRLFNNVKYNYMRLEKRKLIKESFTMGMLELAQRGDYDATRLFNEKGVQLLTKLYSKEELNEFKELFVRTKQNLYYNYRETSLVILVAREIPATLSELNPLIGA